MPLSDAQLLSLVRDCFPDTTLDDIREESGESILARGQAAAMAVLLNDQDALYALMGSLVGLCGYWARRAAESLEFFVDLRARPSTLAAGPAANALTPAERALGQRSDLSVDALAQLASQASTELSRLEASDSERKRHAAILRASVADLAGAMQLIQSAVSRFSSEGLHIRLYDIVSGRVEAKLQDFVGADGRLQEGLPEYAAAASAVIESMLEPMDHRSPKSGPVQSMGSLISKGHYLPYQEGTIGAASFTSGNKVYTLTSGVATPPSPEYRSIYGESLDLPFVGTHPTTSGTGAANDTYDLTVRGHIVPASVQIEVDGDVFGDDGAGNLISLSGWAFVTGTVNYTSGAISLTYLQDLTIPEAPVSRSVTLDAPFVMQFRNYFLTGVNPSIVLAKNNTAVVQALPPFLLTTVTQVASFLDPLLDGAGISVTAGGDGSMTFAAEDIFGSYARLQLLEGDEAPVPSDELVGDLWAVAPTSLNSLLSSLGGSLRGVDVERVDFVRSPWPDEEVTLTQGGFNTIYYPVIITDAEPGVVELPASLFTVAGATVATLNPDDFVGSYIKVAAGGGLSAHRIASADWGTGETFRFTLETEVPLLTGTVSEPFGSTLNAQAQYTSQQLQVAGPSLVLSSPGLDFTAPESLFASYTAATQDVKRPIRVGDYAYIPAGAYWVPTDAYVVSKIASGDSGYYLNKAAPENHQIFSVGYYSWVQWRAHTNGAKLLISSLAEGDDLQRAIDFKFTGSGASFWDKVYGPLLDALQQVQVQVAASTWPAVKEVDVLLSSLSQAGLSWLTTRLFRLDWSALSAASAPALSETDALEETIARLLDAYGQPSEPEATIVRTTLDDFEK